MPSKQKTEKNGAKKPSLPRGGKGVFHMGDITKELLEIIRDVRDGRVDAKAGRVALSGVAQLNHQLAIAARRNREGYDCSGTNHILMPEARM